MLGFCFLYIVVIQHSWHPPYQLSHVRFNIVWLWVEPDSDVKYSKPQSYCYSAGYIVPKSRYTHVCNSNVLYVMDDKLIPHKVQRLIVSTPIWGIYSAETGLWHSHDMLPYSQRVLAQSSYRHISKCKGSFLWKLSQTGREWLDNNENSLQ